MIAVFYLQNRMNYELRAVRFDYSRSVFGAEHVRQVGALKTRKQQQSLHKTGPTETRSLGNLNERPSGMLTTFSAEMAAKYGAPVYL